MEPADLKGSGLDLADLAERKQAMRRTAYDARNAQEEKDRISALAVHRLLELPDYQRARTVMWYIDCRSELRTRQALTGLLTGGQTIVVPYCTVDEQGQNKLGLWRLEQFEDLVLGKWKILEPPQDRWLEPDRVVRPEELDAVVVPGVGFSRTGARMGNGQGYYDRLLDQVRRDCCLLALCYESQLFEDLLVGPHDVFMDWVVTEQAAYRGRSRG